MLAAARSPNEKDSGVGIIAACPTLSIFDLPGDTAEKQSSDKAVNPLFLYSYMIIEKLSPFLNFQV